ncbi:hypothetical protein GQ53DRAFT_655522 [Thozetella sp. PMI_491]|nr:hypothetical protein GQ53DRAFT_655522 [Thozetella sp. PMI_491]
MDGHPGHARGFSQDYGFGSPRWNSRGEYATANVSDSRATRNESSSSSYPKHRRRHSYSQRAADSPCESDEDEYIEIDGVTYLIPARSRSRRHDYYYTTVNPGGHRTNHRSYVQGGRIPVDKEAGYASPMYYDAPPPRPSTRVRRSSTSVPQRPATVAPQAAAKRRPPKEPSPSRSATDADAKRHRIPNGYSLKNWDPSEEPIILLGSVFDANSLGKWIFDWTVHEQGGAGSTPISQIAGDLWLLLINLAGKVKRAEACVPNVRSKDNREILSDFIESGERLMDRFRKLLKTCEKPMLRAGKNRTTQLGSNAGIEFVKTLFGHDREMPSTEKFMQSVRLWDLRFEANVEEILANPTK